METEKRKQRFELIEAIVLSVAVVAIAWSAYQSAWFGGQESLRLANAGTASRTALEKRLFVQEQLTADGIVVTHILDALVQSKSNIVAFYIKRIRPELRAPVEAWLALKPLENPDAPPHPLAMPEYTKNVLGPLRTDEQKLTEDAQRQLALARKAKELSDRFVLFNVLLAGVLFFTGIAGKFDPGKRRMTLIVFASIILVGVVVIMMATHQSIG